MATTETIYLRVPPPLKAWLEEEKRVSGKPMQSLIIEHLEAAKKKSARAPKTPLDKKAS